MAADAGLHFDEQSVAAIVDAVTRWERGESSSAGCRASAERFSEAVFDEAICRHVTAALARA